MASTPRVTDYGGFAPRGAAPVRRQLTVDDYVEGVLKGDRTVMGRAITLVESRNAEHRKLAQQILVKLLPHAGKAHRVGVTGVPGVGKSTFIEALGKHLTAQGKKVAVLAVDPTSARTGGSILGDKTRMNELAIDPNAFIRPSPSSCTLGGVTRTTRETMVIVEAAGYDVVLVETVGVGQSETMVSEMVDFFLVLMLPGAGDELQGIKKGVLEIADMIAVNKADSDPQKARLAAREYRTALHIMTPASPNWQPPVVTVSALVNQGLDELWTNVESHRDKLTASGELPAKRQEQQLQWMWQMVRDQLMDALVEHPDVKHQLPQVEKAVATGDLTPALAAHRILEAFGIRFEL